MIQTFETYLAKLRTTAADEQTEHTSRAALENLLNAFAAEGVNIRVQHEPRRVEGKGAPDFRISQNAMILGYVEVKALGANLDQVLKSDQIKKYLTLSGNIILTDYLHFILIGPKGVKLRASLAFVTDLEQRNFRLKPENVKAVEELLRQFFTQLPEGIGASDKLAMALATRSKILRDFLGDELVRQEKVHDQGKLWGLYGELKRQVFHDLSLKEFADAFAQMLAYGLFLAKLNAEAKEVTLANAKGFIPTSFQLIRELVDFLDELDKDEYADIKWVIVEILAIVNGLDLAAIHNDLSFRQRKASSRKVRAKDEEEHRLFERDPFIYFYEDFLKAFDKDTRKGRGVYYTPPPIVNFIVRAVDDILKDKFEIADGLADHKRVQVLDFACGTGTFLLEVMNRIFDNIGGPDKGKAAALVREHILKNIYGFEYLIAPYTIAHLKLSQYLKDKGHPLQPKDRLQVFLTNTLEPIEPQGNMLLPAVTEEVKAAQGVKDKPILVIVGNPPYSGHSKNMGPTASSSVAKYREGFPELSKPAQGKWLQDDYVKFVRFAQAKMDNVEEGVVAIIANHRWLDNRTFKGMRKSLLGSFQQIFVLDFHGYVKVKTPEGLKDDNVFDIKQGVAVVLFIKNKKIETGVWHSDVWGKRQHKYEFAAHKSYRQVQWANLSPSAPTWLFQPQDFSDAEEYFQFSQIAELFGPMGSPASGFLTTHDEFAISFTKEDSHRKVEVLLSSANESEARQQFRLCRQDQWNYEAAKDHLEKIRGELPTKAISYRPFDTRWTVWDRHVAVHRRERINAHLGSRNVALVTCRAIAGSWMHVFCSELAPDDSFVSNKSRERGFVFPAYFNDEENISSEFRTFLDARYDHHYDPEEILGYIYAILHAPSYRRRYAEFLRIDFPRIPFCETRPQFDVLAALGWELV